MCRRNLQQGFVLMVDAFIQRCIRTIRSMIVHGFIDDVVELMGCICGHVRNISGVLAFQKLLFRGSL